MGETAADDDECPVHHEVPHGGRDVQNLPGNEEIINLKQSSLLPHTQATVMQKAVHLAAVPSEAQEFPGGL